MRILLILWICDYVFVILLLCDYNALTTYLPPAHTTITSTTTTTTILAALLARVGGHIATLAGTQAGKGVGEEAAVWEAYTYASLETHGARRVAGIM